MVWSRDQAIAFFSDHTAKADQDSIVEVDRYIVAGAGAWLKSSAQDQELRTNSSARSAPLRLRRSTTSSLPWRRPLDALERKSSLIASDGT